MTGREASGPRRGGPWLTVADQGPTKPWSTGRGEMMSGHTEANRRNALVSTGPKTPQGKAQSSRNALRHGLASALAVVEGLEQAQDWQAHHDGIVAGLAPVGTLEETFAE